MSFRPIDKRERVPTIDDADHKGRVQAFYKDQWVVVDYHTAATFPSVQYWASNKQVNNQQVAA